MIHLSERLCRIFEQIPAGAAVCDVGTDHGYLPAALMQSGRACRVIATDIRQKPLESARKNLAEFGIQTVELRLCDGLAAVSLDEVDTVVIAGMGGEVIAGILDRARWLQDRKYLLLLQAMTSAEALRLYLAKTGFEIQEESTLSENGKVYSVIKARFTGKPYDLTEAQYFAGNITVQTPSGRAYLEKQYRRCKECAEQMQSAGLTLPEYDRCQKAAEQLFFRLSEE